MLQVQAVEDLRREIGRWRKEGKRVGFVPTMGALHEGHLSLVGLARSVQSGQGGHADRVVVSVFVNPTQFGPNEDFTRYPRQPERDAGMLKRAGCDLLFLPEVETMYPPGNTVYVDLGSPSEGLEGHFRPGHFRGVATVVALLFNLVQPDVAVFGEKDAQQLAVVRKLVRDLHFPVEIVAAPTIREEDGLAMSSRNAYLSPEERRSAAVLHRSLRAAEAAIAAGERRGDEVRRILSRMLNSEPLARVEYAEVVDAETFQPVETLKGRLVLPLAVRVGGTRLIDNLQLAVEG